MLLRKPKKKAADESRAQESMDKLSVWFCDKLHTVNGFAVEIAAGHVVSIGKEAR